MTFVPCERLSADEPALISYRIDIKPRHKTRTIDARNKGGIAVWYPLGEGIRHGSGVGASLGSELEREGKP
jgi:hypothetical protein